MREPRQSAPQPVLDPAQAADAIVQMLAMVSAIAEPRYAVANAAQRAARGLCSLVVALAQLIAAGRAHADGGTDAPTDGTYLWTCE